MAKKCRRFTEEEKQYIRERAPHTTYAQVARELGVRAHAVTQWARMHGVRNDINEVRRAQLEFAKSLALRRNDINKKISATMKETFRKERLRDKYGLDLHTSRIICGMPTKIRCFRTRSHILYGYIMQNCRLADSDPYVMYYDENTRRYKNEELMSKRYYIRFEPIENYPEDKKSL